MSIQIEQLSEEEREEIINYGIRRSIVISISIIVTIMAGYLLGIVWQSIFFLFCFSALRKYAGGYHADTPIRCYFLSFITLFIALMGIKILHSILREIHEGKKRNVYCAAGFKAISIDIDGYIYPCHRFVGDKEFCMGDVSTNVFEHDVIYNQLYKIPEKCKYCICQSICSGGCMHDNLLLMKNINIPAECNCKLQKFLTEQALKIYISLTDIDKKYLFGEESCYGG